jgi:nickel/cobalt exporter
VNETLFLSIASTGFAVAFLHAAIPTHWLPFVLAARGQGWGTGKTLSVTALAGLGHVLFTSLLGILVVWLGIELSRFVGDVFPYLAGGALLAFGIYYLARQALGGGHGHAHGHHGGGHHAAHHHDAQLAPAAAMSDRAAILSLLTLLTFSPCEGFLPVYLSGIQYGWRGFALLSAVLAAATLAGMVLFTWLTLHGLQRIRLGALERFEGAILGGLLCVLGVAVMVFER